MVAVIPPVIPQPLELEGSQLKGLHSAKSTLRLEQIAGLRVRGVGNHVDLPQLVVCGDQSAGKSSVLEGLTGLPFPQQDGLCTKFPTEIILQHTSGEGNIVATILPNPSSPDNLKERMRSYKRCLKNFTELPLVISEAGSLMGVRGFGDTTNGPAFSENVLRIEVSGRVGLHLTVVDLPGLISVPNEEQTEVDVQTVNNLVDYYVASSRTIILAVVQAGNDIANQKIIQKSRLFDKAGKRTVGIITKPDLINKGSEKRIALLAKNQDTSKLKLGYFLIKNPTPTELANGITTEQRQTNEMEFFKSASWHGTALNMDRVGILALRGYLQNFLDQHIARELPRVREEIKILMSKSEQEMALLGESRPSIGHHRMFLSRLATHFNNLVISASNGTYHEADSLFFGGAGNENQKTRLRALVHRLNKCFSDNMRDNGQKRKITSEGRKRPLDSESENGSEDEAENKSEDNMEDDAGDGEEEEEEEEDETGDEIDLEQGGGQVLVTDLKMKEWVQKIYIHSRGKELPGDYNHVLLSELFIIQSSRWHKIAEEHLSTVYDGVCAFVKAGVGHITSDPRVLAELEDITTSRLYESKKAADAELERLRQDERQQPITYNHYYTDNVQRARENATREIIQKAVKESKMQKWSRGTRTNYVGINAEKLLASLQTHVVVDMERQACAEALAGLDAYYKVALKTYVDNVCRQVVERHLMRGLPEILSPEIVASMSDEELQRIASESLDNVEKRKELQSLYQVLKDSLRDLRQ